MFFIVSGAACVSAVADTDEQISKDLSDPVSDLINMPVQMNWDYGGGPKDKGQVFNMKFEPVIPMRIFGDWRVISRSILPVEHKHNFGYGAKTGLGDLTQTFFISPTFRNEQFKWGVGPAFLIPTATEKQLGSEKWGAGPSGVLIYETDNWTWGALVRQIWSFAGDKERSYVNETFLQPFVTRHFKNGWSIKMMPEYTYDWHDHDQKIPINLTVGKVAHFGEVPLSFSVGGRYYLDKPSGRSDWGLRATITFVFPRYIKNFIERKIINEF
ncbi:MAG: hypothetical protein LBU87_02470 [Lactobacillales bacterium]|nr:hypothetical protein [Lactobacillales bacterium]